MATSTNTYDMEVTPERAFLIKQELLRQYCHQYGVEVTGWEERINGVVHKVSLVDTNKQAPA